MQKENYEFKEKEVKPDRTVYLDVDLVLTIEGEEEEQEIALPIE